MDLQIFFKNKLISELKNFGLDPREWCLNLENMAPDQPQLITHISDHHFQLIGFLNKSLQWESIQLLTL